jgi:hypothetical protein
MSEGQHDHADRIKVEPQKYLAIADIYERILGIREGTILEYSKKMEGRE